ncbi:MAG: ABC transporter substrate-binding protein [Rhodospirillaceae bacterium]
MTKLIYLREIVASLCLITSLFIDLHASAQSQPVVSGLPGLRTNEEGKIIVGATVPTTGPLATSGLLYYNALQMAEEDINTAGGIHGKEVDIVFEDTQQSNSTAVSAFIKLVEDHDPVAIFLSSYTPQNFAVEPEVKRAARPAFYGGGADGLHQRGNTWMFRIKQPDSVIVKAMVDTVINRLGKRRPAIVYIQNDYGQGLAKHAEQEFREIGIDPILESHQSADNDLTPQLLSAVGQGADILLSVGFTRDTALLFGARKALGIDLPVISNPTLTGPATLELLSAREIDGAYAVVDAYLPGRIEFDTGNFIGRYERRFGYGVDPSFASNFYDAALMLADGLRAVGTDAKRLREWIATVKDYEGITRTYRADEFGNLGNSVALVRFEPGTKNYNLVDTYVSGAERVQVSHNYSAQAPALSQKEFWFGPLLQSTFNGLAIGCIYALMALGFVLVYEATGVVNFAAGQLVVLGAFFGLTGVAMLGQAPIPGYLFALISMMLLGILFFLFVYLPLQNSPVVTIIVGTIAVGIVIQNLALITWGPLPQRLASPFSVDPFSIGPLVLSSHLLAVIIVTSTVVGMLAFLLYFTALGAQMRAVAQDAETARLMGINAGGVYAFTWALAGVLAGIGGLLMGPVWFVDASMGDALALKAFAATIIGGFGSVPGAIFGGILVGLTESLSASYISSTYKDAIVFLVMVSFLLIRPQGIFGEHGGDRA